MTYLKRAIYKQDSMAKFDLCFDFDEENSNDAVTTRFGNATEKQKDDLLEDRHKQATIKATKTALNTLMDYLREKKLKPLDELENHELPQIPLDFYANLKKVKGGEYKLQTLKCIRAGLNRFTKQHSNLDIINDVAFSKTNEMFKAVTTKARKSGLGSTKSTPPIELDDLAKCAQYFQHDVMNTPSPRKVEACVLFI